MNTVPLAPEPPLTSRLSRTSASASSPPASVLYTARRKMP